MVHARSRLYNQSENHTSPVSKHSTLPRPLQFDLNRDNNVRLNSARSHEERTADWYLAAQVQYQNNKQDIASGKSVPISVTAHQDIGRAQKAPVTGVVVSRTTFVQVGN